MIHVREIDLLDGTPIIDIKPYLPYADAFPEANSGWLTHDPVAAWRVDFSEKSESQFAWIAQASEADANLKRRVEQTLSAEPRPRAYRRIRAHDDGTFVLAVREWRVRFRVAPERVYVDSVFTGFRSHDLAVGELPGHRVHRAFAATFGVDSP